MTRIEALLSRFRAVNRVFLYHLHLSSTRLNRPLNTEGPSKMQRVCFSAKNVTCPSSLDADAPAGTKRAHHKHTSLTVLIGDEHIFHSCLLKPNWDADTYTEYVFFWTCFYVIGLRELSQELYFSICDVKSVHLLYKIVFLPYNRLVNDRFLLWQLAPLFPA